MTECCDFVPPPPEPTNPPRLAMDGDAELVLDPGIPTSLTTREETDAIGAMRRGLAEYLARAEKDVAGVRVRFSEVFEEWAESDDDNVRYPAAAVLAPEDIMYDGHAMTPSVLPERLPDGRNVVKMSEATCELVVEVHCSSPGERDSVRMMLEEALNPVDFVYGFILYLPFYFGMRAVFALLSLTMPDDETSARHGLRMIRLKISAQVSVVRPRTLPEFKPKLQLTVNDLTTPNAAPPKVTAGLVTAGGVSFSPGSR